MRMAVEFRYRPYLGSLLTSILARRHHLLMLGIGISSWSSAKIHCAARSSLLITELARDEEVTALQDTQARSDRHRIKVLDL